MAITFRLNKRAVATYRANKDAGLVKEERIRDLVLMMPVEHTKVTLGKDITIKPVFKSAVDAGYTNRQLFGDKLDSDSILDATMQLVSEGEFTATHLVDGDKDGKKLTVNGKGRAKYGEIAAQELAHQLAQSENVANSHYGCVVLSESVRAVEAEEQRLAEEAEEQLRQAELDAMDAETAPETVTA